MKRIAISLLAALLLMPLTAAGARAEEEVPEQPPTPAFQTYPADTSYTCGHVRLIYVGPHPHYYFTLSLMPKGVDYFQIDVTDRMAQQQLKTIQLAAEHGWHVGVYHQPPLTTNVLKAAYVTAHIPPPETK